MTYALITGASGGIGLALARELAKRKYNLLLTARSGDRLAEECRKLKSEFSIEANFFACDLSLQDGPNAILQWINSNAYSVSILINNAGYGIWGRVEHSHYADLENMIRLNVESLTQLCHVFIPELKKQPEAYILNVASTAAYQAVPLLTTYAATKAFVVLFTRGLRWELKGTSVSVSCLSPGATSTGFIDRAGMMPLKERADQFSMSSEEVARIAIQGMFKRKAEIIPGFINWITVKLTYLVPKIVTEKIAFGLYDDSNLKKS